MDDPHRKLSRHHRFTMVALFLLIASVYMLTYSGYLRYNDELQMYNTTASIIEFRDVRYDLALWNVWEGTRSFSAFAGDLYPVPSTSIELGQAVAALPFYLLGRSVPGIGLLHATWLLNVFLGAAIAVLTYAHGTLLGYRRTVALVSALLLSLGTALWPYSRTLMRELLLVFLLLLSIHLVERGRRGSNAALMMAALAFVAAGFTKAESVILLPALLMFSLPSLPWLNRRQIHRVGAGILMLIATGILILIYTDILNILFPQSTLVPGTSLLIRPHFFRTALHSYLLSPNVSLWATSPVLLLALPGGWLLVRAGRWRAVWAAVLATLAFALGHALTTGPHWFAGATLPPRFLIPVIPFIWICVMPALDSLLRPRAAAIWLAGGGLLVLFSLWWQITSVVFPWSVYVDMLPTESGGVTSWPPSLNRLEYMRPIVLTPLLFSEPWDFVWVRQGLILWPLVFGSAVVLTGILLWRGSTWLYRQQIVAAAGVALIFTGGVLWGLRAIHVDEVYSGDNLALHSLAAFLAQEEKPGDVLIVNDPVYHKFFLNHRDFDLTRVLILPYAPGERGSFEQVPEVISADVVEQLKPGTTTLLANLAQRRDRLWLLMDTGPFHYWSYRPVERYMATAYYPVREISMDPPDPRVRLLEFSMVPAAAADAAQVAVGALFDTNIRLASVALPAGHRLVPGGLLPISLYWRAESPVIENFSVALFLVNAEGVVFVDGMPVQGYDWAPVAGFMPAPRWPEDEIIRDNHTLRLPPGLPAGEYGLAIRLYRLLPDGTFVILPVEGGEALPDDLLKLPLRIRTAGAVG